ncbi:junctional protein associated with coronary artery disease [Protopterus annectens]|uniref:junctional protein associated with coronary artery disease n=1 Tax=Protopterus annectens TaxID=7888 RepID=UPI001CFA0BCF|nr:junctional protein associated with coronary artery disease [Protopterus annectens]XP_043913488.1 junctional protein associated with coronary artery disease [Protopterus annectens]
MFSVEDLLVSHGYKVSSEPSSSFENRYTGYQHEMVKQRPCNGTLNGYEADHEAERAIYSYSKKIAAKKHSSGNQNSHGSQGNSSYPGDQQDATSFQITEAGFRVEKTPEYSTQPTDDKDTAYWRRQERDFNILLDYTDQKDLQKGNANSANPGHLSKGQEICKDGKERHRLVKVAEVRGEGVKEKHASEIISNNAVDQEWQHRPTKDFGQFMMSQKHALGDQMDKLQQHSYCLTDANSMLYPQNQCHSLPKYLPSESTMSEMPLLLTHDKHFFNTKSVFGTHESDSQDKDTKQMEPNLPKVGTHISQSTKPKYGKPLMPTSCEIYQQVSGNTDRTADSQDYSFVPTYFIKPEGIRQNYEDYTNSGVEPPLYVPPPSYKSPLQQNIPNEYLQDGQEYDAFRCNIPQMTDKYASQQLLMNHYSLEDSDLGKEFSVRTPYYLDFTESNTDSVQYIPFDDPRIRHIPTISEQSDCKGINRRRDPSQLSKTSSTEKVYHQSKHERLFSLHSEPSFAVDGGIKYTASPMQSRKSTESKQENGVPDQAKRHPTPQYSDHNTHLTNKVDTGESLAGPITDSGHGDQSMYDSITKVKKFETCVSSQELKNSKKKKSETVFCLVSVPLKPQSALLEAGNNSVPYRISSDNNVRDLKDQSLLSASSTDLELQELTASMTNLNEQRKEAESNQKPKKQIDGLCISPSAKHRELKHSGSWPGEQQKGQEKGHIFMEDNAHVQPFLHHKRTSMSNKEFPKWTLLDSKCHVEAKGASFHGKKPDKAEHAMKGQMKLKPSSNSAFSRTAAAENPVHKTKACQSLSDGALRGTNNTKKHSVQVKKESESSNNKEAFGQFLLKPVSRRPWDAISELESFNKELQDKEENNCNGHNTKNEMEPIKHPHLEKQCSANEAMRKDICSVKKTSIRPVRVSKAWPPDPSKVKQKSWSFDMVEHDSDQANVTGLPQMSLKPKNILNRAITNTENSLNKDEISSRKAQHEMKTCSQQTELANPCSEKNRSSNTGPRQSKISVFTKSKYDPDNRDENRKKRNNISVDVFKKDALVTHLDVEGESSICKMKLPLHDDVQYALEQEAKWDSGKEIKSCTNKETPGDKFEMISITDCPQTESMETRAARILGIDIADEPIHSIKDCTHPILSHITKHDNCSLYPETIMVNISDLMDDRQSNSKGNTSTVEMDNEWKNKLARVKALIENVQYNKTTMNEDSSNHRLEEKHKEIKAANETALHKPQGSVFINSEEDKQTAAASLEKKGKSTSKMIETLQGKLASTPTRTVMDRLVRMKEVDSVSRMRRLSFKSIGSEDEIDEKTNISQQEWDNSHCWMELDNKVTEVGTFPKRDTILNNGMNFRSKSGINEEYREVCLFDEYDPSRVETV